MRQETSYSRTEESLSLADLPAIVICFSLDPRRFEKVNDRDENEVAQGCTVGNGHINAFIFGSIVQQPQASITL